MPTNWYEIRFIWGQSIEVYDEAKAQRYADSNCVERVAHTRITRDGIERTIIK